jgi:hypothetical protein
MPSSISSVTLVLHLLLVLLLLLLLLVLLLSSAPPVTLQSDPCPAAVTTVLPQLLLLLVLLVLQLLLLPLLLSSGPPVTSQSAPCPAASPRLTPCAWSCPRHSAHLTCPPCRCQPAHSAQQQQQLQPEIDRS